MTRWPLITLHRRPRPVTRQLQQRRHSRQLLAPVLQLLPPTLPPSATRAARPRSRHTAPPTPAASDAPVAVRLVKRRHFPHQHSHGPAVADDVVHHQQQHMFLLTQLQQTAAAAAAPPPASKVACAFSCASRPRPPPVLLRQTSQVQYLPHSRSALSAMICTASPVHTAKPRAQRFVPPHQLLKACASAPYPTARSTAPPPHVVEGAARFQLVQKPQPLLRK